MKRIQNTLTELNSEIDPEFVVYDDLITMINSINDEEIFTELYKKRIVGTPGEAEADIIYKVLQRATEKGIDIHAHVESLVRFQKLTKKD